MGKNRRFAKKGEEVRRFKLVARSQQDANVDDPGATPLVLEAFAAPGDSRRTGLAPEELCSIPVSLQGLGPEVFGLGEKDEESDEDEDEDEDEEELDEEALEALERDCYFPRDGYNYDQHLKRITRSGQGGVGGVVMDAPKPKKGEKDLFATEKDIAIQKPMTEEERELMAALDNASDYEEADEEFLDELIPAGVACDFEEMMWGPSAKEYKDMPDIAEWKARYAAMRGDLLGMEDGLDFLGGETGSSAGGWRPGGPAMNDADFTAFLDKEYGEEEIGECEGEEIEGNVDLEEKVGQEILDEYIQDKVDEQEKLMSMNEPVKGKHERDDVPRTVTETKAIIEKHYLVEEDDLETQDGYQDLDRETVDESRSWDCESVLSTLSNISNRPGKIANIKVVKKPGPPLKPVKEDADTEDSGESEEDDVVELPDVNTTRRRGETAEERRERKAGVKEMRRICRRMKKESKDTYKEAAKVPAQPGTGDVRRKLRTFKFS